MKFINVNTVRARKAKKAGTKTNPSKKGSFMAKKKSKKRHNPKRKHSVKKRHNPVVMFKKHTYRKRRNPAPFSTKGIVGAIKDIAIVTVGIIVVAKAMSMVKIKDQWKNWIGLGVGAAAVIMIKNPIVRVIGVTVAAMSGKNLLAAQFPDFVSGDDEMLISADDYEMQESLISGQNALISGSRLSGTNSLLQGDYIPAYDAANDSGMGY